MSLYDDSTCFKCGANAWTDCNHRKAVTVKPNRTSETDMRENQVKHSGGGRYRIPSGGQGRNFKRRKD